jgi:hypothetical protein
MIQATAGHSCGVADPSMRKEIISVVAALQSFLRIVGRNVFPAARNLADRTHEFRRRALLLQVPRRARLKRARGVLLLGVHAEDQYSGPIPSRLDNRAAESALYARSDA